MRTTLPEPLQQALAAKTAGATGVARMVIAGLLEIVDDRAALEAAIDFLTERLTGYAPLWHIGNAVRGDHPAQALRQIRVELDDGVDRSVAVATHWVGQRGGGPVAIAPSSSVVGQVLARLGEPAHLRVASVGLAGADAIGPDAVLNIVGTRELAARLPVLVVTTALKLVPGDVFERLGAPVFERIPLDAFAGVVVDGEVMEPRMVGRRAAALQQ
jgi:hypothetical protein